jgi:hypothetical protein
MRIGLIAAALLTAPLWGQTNESEIAKQRAQMFATMQSGEIAGDREADAARQEKILDGMNEIVSNYVIARINAAPDISPGDLRDGLIQVLGYDQRPDPHESPYVFRINPPYLSNRPVVFSIVDDGAVCYGIDCARIVVESYALDHGKARLAGRGGSEMNGIVMQEARGGAEQVGADELLVQGQRTWASGHVLPFKVALYRVSETGVQTVWQTPITPGVIATVFGGHLMVEYHDEELDSEHKPDTRLDVYSLDNGVPKLVFQRDF